MRTSRQPHLKSVYQTSGNNILPWTVHDWSRTSRFEVKSKLTSKPAVANSHSRQLRQRSPQIRRRWPALANEARKARKARQARKGKVMARASRKKVNIGTRTRIQVMTLFVGTSVRKAIWAQNVGRIQRINPAPVELKTKEVKEKRRTSQTREQARWTSENKNHSRSQLLQALQTCGRLKLLSDHRTEITKVGWDGHMTQVRRFRHFRLMQGLARNRRRIFEATRQLQAKSRKRWESDSEREADCSEQRTPCWNWRSRLQSSRKPFPFSTKMATALLTTKELGTVMRSSIRIRQRLSCRTWSTEWMLTETAPLISQNSRLWWPGRWRTRTQKKNSDTEEESFSDFQGVWSWW